MLAPVKSGVPPPTFLREGGLFAAAPALSPPPVAGSTAKAPARRLSLGWHRPVLAPQSKLGASAKEQAPAAAPGADGLARDGDASVAEGGQAADLAAALKKQTEALFEVLSARSVSNSITMVKTDLVWPTLTDNKKRYERCRSVL